MKLHRNIKQIAFFAQKFGTISKVKAAIRGQSQIVFKGLLKTLLKSS